MDLIRLAMFAAEGKEEILNMFWSVNWAEC